jgi:hypothetical protein
MTKLLRSTAVSLVLFAVSLAHGGIPAMTVTVSNASEKAAFKGTTNASGAFSTTGLKPGNYVVQLNAKTAAMKGDHYAIVVSAGQKKVVANGVPAEKFAGGGVALRVEVGSGLNITGQVSPEANGAVKNGKIMVWIPPMLGSNMPGHWAEKGSAEEISSRTRNIVPRQNIQKIHDDSRGF